MEHREGNFASFHRLFQHNVKANLFVFLCVFQLEVSQLEGSLQQPKAQSAMSPYLVPDTQALCQHLAVVKQLATSGRFIIIIPRIGTGALLRVMLLSTLLLLSFRTAAAAEPRFLPVPFGACSWLMLGI